MRVLIFSTDDHLYPAGGAEQAFGHITSRLPHIEFDVICAKLRRGVGSYEKIGNVHIHRMGFGIPKVDGFILALFGHHCAYKLMKQHTYDLLWSIMASYGAFSALRVKKKTGVPMLLTLQEGDAFEYIYNRVRFVRKQFNEIFVYADGIQAISRYLLSWGKQMGYSGTYGRVIPNGVAVDAFTQIFKPETIHAKRTAFGFLQDAFILFTSSRLEKKNGIGDVLSALALLPKQVCFIICGSGSLGDTLQAQVVTLGLQKRVRFMGFVDPSELPLLMKSCDAFIRPSLSEGLGNAFLEAMAAGIITIGTNAGGIPDFLTHNQTGFVVEIENPKSIAETVQKIMTLDAVVHTQIIQKAELMVLQSYNWDVVTKDMENLFCELVTKK